MSLKRQNQMQAAFSMASMTDVIFLLLVFFMVTSTFVFPTAMEVNLPQGSEQTSEKPKTCVFIDSVGNVSAAFDRTEPRIFARSSDADLDALRAYLADCMAADTTQRAVAVYADKAVDYGRVVDVLNAGSSMGVKMVLATTPSPKKAALADEAQP